MKTSLLALAAVAGMALTACDDDAASTTNDNDDRVDNHRVDNHRVDNEERGERRIERWRAGQRGLPADS